MDAREKVYKYLVNAFIIALCLVGAYFFLKAYVHGQEVFFDAAMEKSYIQRILDRQCGLSKEDRKYYQEKVEFHRSNGERCYYAAKDKCWWLPNLENREKAKYCWTSMMSTFAATGPTAKLASAILTALTQYGLDVIDEWFYIQNKLHYAHYHLDMAEFYQDVLINDVAKTKKKKKK